MPLPPQSFRVVWLGSAIALTTGLILVDWRFLTRAATYPETPIMNVEWYRPRARVPGQPTKPLPTSTRPLDPPFAEALRQIATYAGERNSTGLIVLHRGEIVLEQYWQGYDETSTFNAMSMSKTLLGLLVGVAIAEGSIGSLDDPVATYLPEWQGDERGQITVRDLIYMQSGLRNDRRTDTIFSDLVRLYLSSDVAQVALQIPAVAPPGKAYDYNNVDSQVLSLVLQRATGVPYAEYLSTRLWQPLGATDASVWLDRPQGTAKTFCCFFATARDWARIGQMLVAEGQVGSRQVIPQDWLQQMLTPSPLEPTFGAHVWVKARTADYPNVDQNATAPFLAPDTFYLDGRGLQRVYVIPSQALVIVRMGEDPVNWNDAVLPNTLVKALSVP